ncbi:hypothetical protein DCAR_0313136 [Daucus carota subsp. sativus]|uniref:BED-type domain-containing protein n=1 Tax=Daucus carota subsp. sativus TaxID=79200 RepID=A0AAF0WR64_DAUCS|nr:hypothetical protein DCAR_0313136 [Daucus carota subsp. sativus]
MEYLKESLECSQIYSCEHGTSNMQKHMLKHGHNVVGDELENAPFDQKVYRDLMGKAIIKHNLPFNYVEYDGVWDVQSYLNSNVQPILKNTIIGDILDTYRFEKRKMKDILQSLPGKVCLTSDLWSSSVMDGYLSITDHFV